MADCIFCAIASGDVPSAKVYEDDQVIAFLDIHPLARGHTLIIPRHHVAKLEELAPSDASALMGAVCRLVPAACATAGVADATVAVNDGPDAGQEVPHLHVHVVPRHAGDGGGPVHALFRERPEMDQDQIEAFAQTLRGRLEATA